MQSRIPTILFGLAILGFLIKISASFHLWGRQGFNDETSEALSIGATRTFITEGFAPSKGLPVYREFWTESPITELLHQTGFYTHLLPGPEYALYGIFKIFGDGESGIRAARVPPFLLFFIGMVWFCILLEKRVCDGWPWAKGLAAIWIFSTPAIYSWAPSIYGHAYTSAFVVLLLCLGMIASEIQNAWLYYFICFLLGGLTNLFLAEASIIACAAPIVGHWLTQSPLGTKKAWLASFFVGVGLTVVFAAHFWQVAAALNSWELAKLDQFGTAAIRSAHRGMDRMQIIGNFSKYSSFAFRVGALTMLFFGGFAIWLMIKKPTQQIKLGLALLVSTLAGYAFPFMFKVHSETHHWRVHRVFQLEFYVFIAITLSLIVNHLRERRRI